VELLGDVRRLDRQILGDPRERLARGEAGDDLDDDRRLRRVGLPAPRVRAARARVDLRPTRR
jgi:hypothetical protein